MDRIVVLGEQRSTVDLVATAFERQKVAVARMERCADVTVALADTPYLLVIVCVAGEDEADLGVVSRLSVAVPDTPIVPAVAPSGLDLALPAVRRGAFDIMALPPEEETIHVLLMRTRLHRRHMILRRLAIISQFSGWFAHEVRNPLSGILNSAQLLTGESVVSDRLQRYRKLILQEGVRIEEFLKRVTEFGRFQRGPLIRASLNTVAERALSRAEPELRRRHIRPECDFDSRLPEVRMDVPRVEAAVSRLIANAAAAMPTGGVLAVLTRHRPDEGIVELEVTDTDADAGPERERQLFGRCESSRLKETGLGLAAALQTFAEHGGDLSFRILSDRGCSIAAQLPVNGWSGRS